MDDKTFYAEFTRRLLKGGVRMPTGGVLANPSTTIFLVNKKRHITMAQVEKIVFDHALSFCGGSRTKAAKVLGVGKATFYRKKPVKGKKK